MKDVCFHCEKCIATTPPQYPNSCAVRCDECECDICDTAGKKKEQP